MSPRKNRPVLYEVHARTLRGKGRSFIPRTPQPPAPPSATPPAAPAVVPEAVDLPAGMAAFDGLDETSWSGVRYAAGRVYLALGWPHLVVLGAALLCLIVASFQAGRSSVAPPRENVQQGSATLADALSATPVQRAAPPDALPTPTEGSRGGDLRPGQGRGHESVVATPYPPTISGTNTPTATAQESQRPTPVLETPASFTPQRGSFHVLVQYFRRAARGDADRAAAYLTENGVPAAVLEGAGDWQLVATQAFTTEAQARTLVDRIKSLGREYFRAGGGYSFDGAAARRY